MRVPSVIRHETNRHTVARVQRQGKVRYHAVVHLGDARAGTSMVQLVAILPRRFKMKLKSIHVRSM